MRIRVSPKELQLVARQCRQASAELHTLASRLGRLLNDIDRETQQTIGIDGRVASARERARALADQAESLACALDTQSHRFLLADRGAARKLATPDAGLASPLSPQNLSTLPLSTLNTILELGGVLQPVQVEYTRLPAGLQPLELDLPSIPLLVDPAQVDSLRRRLQVELDSLA
jgi:hypothetical protein